MTLRLNLIKTTDVLILDFQKDILYIVVSSHTNHFNKDKRLQKIFIVTVIYNFSYI